MSGDGHSARDSRAGDSHDPPFQIRGARRNRTSIVTNLGRDGGGGEVPIGMFSLTACVWIGIVMMSMMSSTSINVDQRGRIDVHHHVRVTRFRRRIRFSWP